MWKVSNKLRYGRVLFRRPVAGHNSNWAF